MKKALTVLIALCILYSCKLPSYSYVPATMNTTPYSHPLDGQLGFFVGSAGIGAKGGLALTQNINVNAWGAIFPVDSNRYGSKESEYSIGVQTNPTKHNGITSFYFGYGNGSNQKEKTGLSGHFNRLFLQVQTAACDRPLGKARFDAFIGLRANFLSYKGTRRAATFNHDLFYYEPYFGASVGGEMVRFELLQGLAIKHTGEWGYGLEVFPYFGSIGLLVKLHSKKRSMELTAP